MILFRQYKTKQIFSASTFFKQQTDNTLTNDETKEIWQLH